MRFLKDEREWCRKLSHNLNDCFNVSKRSRVVLENNILQKSVETSVESPHYPGKK